MTYIIFGLIGWNACDKKCFDKTWTYSVQFDRRRHYLGSDQIYWLKQHNFTTDRLVQLLLDTYFKK